VESKNWTLVRRCLGYRWFEGENQLADLRQLETLLALRTNVLQPSMALLEKVRTGKHPSPWTKGLGGSRIQKRCHAPLTPLHRFLQAPEVSDQAKARLLRKTSQDTSLGAVIHRTISL